MIELREKLEKLQKSILIPFWEIFYFSSFLRSWLVKRPASTDFNDFSFRSFSLDFFGNSYRRFYTFAQIKTWRVSFACERSFKRRSVLYACKNMMKQESISVMHYNSYNLCVAFRTLWGSRDFQAPISRIIQHVLLGYGIKAKCSYMEILISLLNTYMEGLW